MKFGLSSVSNDFFVAFAYGGSNFHCMFNYQGSKKITKSAPIRKEKAENAKTLGEVIKHRRMDCKMTQEFVAEALGVSRQAVSKWENGTSDPSTSNLMALAKLFGVSAEDLLNEAR